MGKWLSVRLRTSCSHLNFRFRACFELRVPWHSGNYRVWIHSETRLWHDKKDTTTWSYLLNESLMENFIFVQYEFFTWEEWPSGLKCYIQNWKVFVSNPTRCFAGLSDLTSLRGTLWLSGRIKNKKRSD